MPRRTGTPKIACRGGGEVQGCIVLTGKLPEHFGWLCSACHNMRVDNWGDGRIYNGGDLFLQLVAFAELCWSCWLQYRRHRLRQVLGEVECARTDSWFRSI